MTIDTPGVYDGMPDAEYHADPVPGGSLSSSGARRILDCPALFRYEQDHPVHRDVFDFGSAAHLMVLGTGAPLAILDADDWRTKAAKEWRDATRAEGCIPLLKADHERVQAMAAAIREHPVASSAFDPARGGKPEQSLFWQEYGITGAWLRARLDWMPDPSASGRMIIADYKTTACASPDAIAKSVANFGYHQQAAWYLDGVRELMPGSDPAFVFVFQEKTPPYLVTVCQLDGIAERAGRQRNALAIERWRDCTASGIWPGYSPDPREIELISLPPWALRAEEYA